jgi:hypothetical protein
MGYKSLSLRSCTFSHAHITKTVEALENGAADFATCQSWRGSYREAGECELEEDGGVC